jgi:hypothetical protein
MLAFILVCFRYFFSFIAFFFHACFILKKKKFLSLFLAKFFCGYYFFFECSLLISCAQIHDRSNSHWVM